MVLALVFQQLHFGDSAVAVHDAKLHSHALLISLFSPLYLLPSSLPKIIFQIMACT